MADTKTPAAKASPEELNAMIAALEGKPELQAKLKAIAEKGEGKSRKMSDEDILSEYPLVIKNAFGEGKSTRWNPTAKKYEAEISCSIAGCKEHRMVFTSDLFQVKTCNTHKKEQRKAAREARNAERDALIEAGRKALADKEKASE